VRAGKHTDVFDRDYAARIPEERCFSLILKNRTFDLEAKKEEDRNKWVQALRFAVDQAHQLKLLKDDPKAKQMRLQQRSRTLTNLELAAAAKGFQGTGTLKRGHGKFASQTLRREDMERESNSDIPPIFLQENKKRERKRLSMELFQPLTDDENAVTPRREEKKEEEEENEEDVEIDEEKLKGTITRRSKMISILPVVHVEDDEMDELIEGEKGEGDGEATVDDEPLSDVDYSLIDDADLDDMTMEQWVEYTNRKMEMYKATTENEEKEKEETQEEGEPTEKDPATPRKVDLVVD